MKVLLILITLCASCVTSGDLEKEVHASVTADARLWQLGEWDCTAQYLALGGAVFKVPAHTASGHYSQVVDITDPSVVHGRYVETGIEPRNFTDEWRFSVAAPTDGSGIFTATRHVILDDTTIFDAQIGTNTVPATGVFDGIMSLPINAGNTVTLQDGTKLNWSYTSFADRAAGTWSDNWRIGSLQQQAQYMSLSCKPSAIVVVSTLVSDVEPALQCPILSNCAPYHCWVNIIGQTECDQNSITAMHSACYSSCGFDARCPYEDYPPPEDQAWFCNQKCGTDAACRVQCADAVTARKINCERGMIQ